MDDDVDDLEPIGAPFGLPVLHGAETPLYVGNVVPADWPPHADNATYGTWAKFPSWHVEEAASLVCGFQPRRRSDLALFPLDSEPKAPSPYENAKTWNALHHGEIGAILDLFARFKRTSVSELPADAQYVVPAEFIRFCDAYGVEVPTELRDAVTRRGGANRKTDTNERKSQYRARALRVARDLEACGARVTIQMFQGFIENDLPADERVETRSFQDYLREWRGDPRDADGLKDVLHQVLRGRGRLSEEQKDLLRRRLPDKYARMPLGDGPTAKKTK
jgi:hypothetical protein